MDTAVSNRVKVAILHRGDNKHDRSGFSRLGKSAEEEFRGGEEEESVYNARNDERRPRACVRGWNVVRLPRFGLPLF